MRPKKFNLGFPAIMAICVACILYAQAATSQTIRWGQDINSLVLNKTELTKPAGALPGWKIKQMTWPYVTEIASKSVKVDNKLKACCSEWLQKFMKRGYLPADLDKHLVAMKNWGLIRKQAEQKRLCDVFIVRFKKDFYVVHMQESLYNMVIAVADERLAKNSRSDHKQLVIETATTILNGTLKPDPNSENFHEYVSEVGSDRHKISSVTWGIDSLITMDSTGRRTLNLAKAGEIGTTHVDAETDGRFVRFEITKCPGAVKAAFFDPYEERFGQPK